MRILPCLALFGFFLIHSVAHSEVKLHHEPALGILLGNVGVKINSGTGAESLELSETKLAVGPAFSYKFGVKEKYIFAYLDARVGYMFFPDKDAVLTSGVAPTATETDVELNPLLYYTYGLGIAFDWDIPIRLSLGMDFGVTGDMSISAENSDDTEIKRDGSGYKIALGYYLSEETIVNLELQSVDFDSTLSGTFITLTTAWPKYIEYPEISWRERAKGSNRWKDREAETFAPLEPSPAPAPTGGGEEIEPLSDEELFDDFEE